MYYSIYHDEHDIVLYRANLEIPIFKLKEKNDQINRCEKNTVQCDPIGRRAAAANDNDWWH